MKNFSGKVLFLDRADINTDEIIPARYLTEVDKAALKPYLLEDLRLEEFDPQRDLADKNVVITRDNFGCGSSREHAPWALEANDINLVVAPNFARIFRQNMYNCGMMAVELPADVIDDLFEKFTGQQCRLDSDLENTTFTLTAGDTVLQIPFTLAPFDRALVDAGGWINFADNKY